MKLLRLPSLALSLLLQCLPLLRVASADAALVVSPVMAVLRFIAGATAVAGSYHAVSGATVNLLQPAGGKVRATNGVSSPFRVDMSYVGPSGTQNIKPKLYNAVNLPAGFNQPSSSDSVIWRITGTPTTSGIFNNVKVTGYENKDKTGHSFTVALTITVVDAVPVVTTQPPQNLTAAVGGSVTLSVTATGGSLSYQWLKDDLELSTRTDATLTLDPVTLEDAGSYRVRVQNSGGVALSDPTVLTVSPATALPPPVFTTLPAGATVHEGEALTLSAAATGEGPLSFAWFKDSQLLAGDAASFQISAATSADAGAYSVLVTGAGGSTNSPPATVVVVAPLKLGIPQVIPQTGGGELLLPFNGIVGRTYVLESAARLDSPVVPWESLQEITVSDGLGFSVPIPQPEVSVFRVRTK